MNTLIPFNAKGHVWIELIKQKSKIVDKDNVVLATAKNIMAARLANISSSNIDRIKIYNNGLLLSSKLITQRELVATNEVQFVAIYLETDFNGEFDEVQLWCEEYGAFAQLTGFDPQTKPADEQLSVTWKIKIL
jgi:hypothetical protein